MKEIHIFEESGLGKAPFKVVSNSENNHAFFCQHCGTMLKNRYFVKSADNIVSVVGIDCLSKVNQMKDEVKRIKREKAAQKRDEKRAQKIKESEEIQRKSLNGKTRNELLEEIELSITDKLKSLPDMVFEHDMYCIVTKSSFGYEILSSLSDGVGISDNAKKILIEIHAKYKSNSRKGSKAYKEAYEDAKTEIDDYLLPIEITLGKIGELRDEYSLLSNRAF